MRPTGSLVTIDPSSTTPIKFMCPPRDDPAEGSGVQVDGSPHDRFEGRDPRCALIVFIGNATEEWMALRFVVAETTQAYMQTLWTYLNRHGRPVAPPRDARTARQPEGTLCPNANRSNCQNNTLKAQDQYERLYF